MNSYEKTGIEAAVAAASVGTDLDTCTLASGVVLKVKKVSPLLLRRAVQKVTKPVIPVFHDEDRGRDIENPNDPDYLAALAEYESSQGYASLDMMILMGTELISVPEGMDRPEDTDWVELLRVGGIDPDISSDHARYLSWMQLIAITDMADVQSIAMAVARKTAVREVDVQASLDSFRSNEIGRTDIQPELPESITNGHRV